MPAGAVSSQPAWEPLDTGVVEPTTSAPNSAPVVEIAPVAPSSGPIAGTPPQAFVVVSEAGAWSTDVQAPAEVLGLQAVIV
jgi:hypothetical protein